jgi:transposase-like protein
MLSPNRDLMQAKLFLWLALPGGRLRQRIINVDEHPAYASAIADLKQTRELGPTVSLPNPTLPINQENAFRRASDSDRWNVCAERDTRRCMQPKRSVSLDPEGRTDHMDG